MHIELRNIDTGIKIEIKGPLDKPSQIGTTLNDFKNYPCNKLLRGYFAWNLSSLTKIDIAKGKYSVRASYKEELSNEIIVDYQ